MSKDAMTLDNVDRFESSNDRLPKHLCGLDFCFHVFNKMYIQDIIGIEECCVIPGKTPFLHTTTTIL